MEERTCPTCGLLFVAKSKTQTWCSLSCAKRKRPLTRTCLFCIKEFSPKKNKQVMCDKACAARKSNRDIPRPPPDQVKANSPEAIAKRVAKVKGNPKLSHKGAANPAFIDGKNVGTRVYRRYKGRACEDCSATVNPSGRGLLVHHDDGDHYNNDPANLVTLCNSCHAKRHHERGDFG